MLTRSKTIFLLCVFFTCGKLSAETMLGHSAWLSTTHLGFGMEDQSSTGFGGTTGSAMFLDLERGVINNISAGMRTSAFGGKGDNGEFYRLAAGPLVNFRIMNKWNISLALGYFRESGVDDDGDNEFKSKGQLFQFGWERVFPLTKAIQVCWGGFWSRHWGNLDLDESTAPTTGSQASYSSANSNIGNSRGVEFALRVRL